MWKWAHIEKAVQPWETVVALDFVEEMIRFAEEHSKAYVDRITYHVMDATNEPDLLGLGPGTFDVALCNMALFDMADIRPLLSALNKVLKPDGRFVFSPLQQSAYVARRRIAVSAR